ncbi:MAG: hypothetical protein K0R17_167 [Rariglobus sp.]|jgi:uncharacterized protein (DUF1778 family)|nr:hypothetical protein [Rariglobus sp.]
MSTTSAKPTSIRLTAAEKKRIAAAARKRGLTPTAYIKRAALEGAEAKGDDARLDQLERIATALREAVEDEVDYRAVTTAWNRHVKSGAKLLTGAEAWRELGL